jgi:hypothetical protein
MTRQYHPGMADAEVTGSHTGRAVSGVLGIVMVLAIVALIGRWGAATPATTVGAPDGNHVVVPGNGAECGSTLPVSLGVPGATEARDAPMQSVPASHQQVVRRWVAADRTVEVRWPPDRRTLVATAPHPGGDPGLVEGWSTGETGSLSAFGQTVGSTAPLLFEVAPLPDQPNGLSWSCSVVQIRLSMANGASQTLGYRLPLGSSPAGLVDLGALVSLQRTSSAVVPRNRAMLCPDRAGTVASVPGATPSATPVEALRTFLESDMARDVPQPELPRPFEQTLLASDGTYRFEHFVAWTQYVAITVDRMGAGWSVTNWERGEC